MVFQDEPGLIGGVAMNMRYLALTLLLVVLTPPVALAQTNAATPNTSDVELLKQLDDACIAAYAIGRAKMVDRAGPIILVGGDLTLIWNGQKMHASYTPQIYTTLKSLSHVFLGTMGLLEAYADDPAATQSRWQTPLRAMRQKAASVQARFDEFGLSGDSLTRNRYLFDHLLSFIDHVLKQGTYTRAALIAMARPLAPLLLADADQAARAQIDMMNAAIEAWRTKLPVKAWASVLVMIQDAHQPRSENLKAIYFDQLLGRTPVPQVVYAESVFDEKGALKLAGSILIDRAISIDTFEEELRLERDLLGDAADAYLKERFGKLGRPLP
jgi:hypothetical protein